VLTLVRVSHPATKSEQLLLSAVRLLRSPHVIMPHPCATMSEWTSRYASDLNRRPYEPTGAPHPGRRLCEDTQPVATSD
jgi:hypothetical protein